MTYELKHDNLSPLLIGMSTQYSIHEFDPNDYIYYWNAYQHLSLSITKITQMYVLCKGKVPIALGDSVDELKIWRDMHMLK